MDGWNIEHEGLANSHLNGLYVEERNHITIKEFNNISQ